MKLQTRTQPSAKELLITIDKFNGGTNTLVDQSRLAPKFAVQSNNLMQVSDGLWKTRWGTKNFGAALAANSDGASEYVKADGTTELIAIANGVAYKSTDGGSDSPMPPNDGRPMLNAGYKSIRGIEMCIKLRLEKMVDDLKERAEALKEMNVE